MPNKYVQIPVRIEMSGTTLVEKEKISTFDSINKEAYHYLQRIVGSKLEELEGLGMSMDCIRIDEKQIHHFDSSYHGSNLGENYKKVNK